MLVRSIIVSAAAASLVSAISIERREAITDFNGTSPIGFAWPPGRDFNVSSATKAPCGGSPAGSRTSYPLTGGDISLTSKTLLDNLNVLWTNETDPTRFHAFSTYTNSLTELGAGHYCQPGPDFASFGLKAGDDVTLMLMYNLEDNADNYYYCADITLTSAQGFTPSENYMCSNLTSSIQEASSQDSMKVGQTSSSSESTSSEIPQATSADSSQTAGSSSNGLSAAAGGGIGASVSIVVVALLVAAAYVMGYIRFGKKKQVILGDHASDSTGIPVKAAKF
ncbi:uncharacterized protein I303_101418 [Kwoniella dejecticola CBS 10117]|uniref:Copper acquisition factor BIM1-like domain-containing protein n=1 Tax=Kwoniella dejecticola CBS 10117 TaxID=1296121 RepID=A0A1A6AHV6_9TREE|nr:uncharacterized protein I303_01427 [Kwoniella dejecticola CBS 10117]OBR89598.1 hypothetical protein I303_01427 [Kwoniella dejecticola CBS 10117]